MRIIYPVFFLLFMVYDIMHIATIVIFGMSTRRVEVIYQENNLAFYRRIYRKARDRV
jgi:hypothetical protein